MAKILVLIEASRLSGPAKVVVETLNKLRSKHECTFVAFIRGDGEHNEYIDSIRSLGYPVEILRERFRYDPRVLGQLTRIVHNLRPDIIEAHNFKSSFFLVLLNRLNKLPPLRVIHYYHGEVQAGLKQSIYNWIYRLVLRFGREIVVVSNRQKKLLATRGVNPVSITVIRNGIENFAGSVERNPQILKVISVGRLSFEKGHDLLLRALAELRSQKRGGDFKVTIIGEGPQLTYLKQLATESNLAQIVAFEGYFPDTSALYQNADILVLPSRSEGIPMVILEAALHGVPIVSFDVGGVGEVLPDDNSILLVEPENVSKLAAAIETLMLNPLLRRSIATEAMKIVQTNFLVEKRVGEIDALYRQTV